MLKILIVDDSELMRQRLRELISQVPETKIVGEATDGVEALAAFGKWEPDVLILDIRLPKSNGVDILKAVKGQPPAPVVIMLTAFPYPQCRRRCLEAGAEYFFDKSTEFERIVEVLAALEPQEITPDTRTGCPRGGR
jgi:DNA-binding NarL/FixJ family response regulator